ncbi:ABC transporter permease [Chlamydia sp. 17-3921]|uniref:MlaE family ABC transporter permease n=1 Tax=Chlamydia sp. 17-3921 TaxID=2675798 RepID=UPI001918EFDD|nr:ABC transporter permease [Chlamydia sp. 17-3921]
MEVKKKFYRVLTRLPIGIGRWVGFNYIVVKSISCKKSVFRAICAQSYAIGICSLPIVILTGAITGVVLALQSYYQLGVYGLSCAIGFFVVKSILVEIGPVLTALALSGRVGGAIAAFLGTLRMTEQISAMTSLGVNPLRYFALPRIIAGVITMPTLVITAVWSGIFSGYIVCRYAFHIPSQKYWYMVIGNVLPVDVFMVLVKSLAFGFLITSSACYQALGCYRRIIGVTEVTTAGVVISYVSIVFINCVITTIFHRFF